MKYLTFLLFITVSFSMFAGDLSVSPLQLNFFSKGEGRQMIEVKNNTDKVQYVNVDPSRIDNPGETDQSILPINNTPLSFGLVVTPRKLILPPGQSRMIKVMRIQSPRVPNTHDWVYRVDVTPAKGELVAPDESDEDYQLGLRVTIAYAVRVIIRPEQPSLSIKAQRDGKHITVTNTGNTSYLLINARQCKDPKAEKSCQSLGSNYSSHRLYAGNIWRFDVENAEPVTFDQYYLMKKRHTITTN